MLRARLVHQPRIRRQRSVVMNRLLLGSCVGSGDHELTAIAPSMGYLPRWRPATPPAFRTTEDLRNDEADGRGHRPRPRGSRRVSEVRTRLAARVNARRVLAQR